MKKLLGVMTIGLMIAAIGAAQAQTKSRLDRVLANGELRVGTTGDFNPMTIRDPASRSYKGFEIDAAKQLAKDLGVKVRFVPTDWKTLIAGVIADKYDIVMSGTSINVKRAKAVGYTTPYVYVGTIPLTTKAKSPRFKSWDDANQPGVKIAVILGTVFEEQALEAFPKATLIKVEAPATAFQEVLSGRADVTITSNIDASKLVQKYTQLTTIGGGELRNRRPLAYITAQNDYKWINFLNNWLLLKRVSGYYDRLAAKWRLN
jgi:cyclohexadienyl dehydratase